MKDTNKRIWFGLLFMFFCIVGITGCTDNQGGQKEFENSDKISIVTTIYPVYDFTSHIAGDQAEIINLVPAGTEPHDFELSTGDMKLLEKADVFIYNGAGMEHFVDKTLEALSNEDLIVVEAAGKINMLESEEGTDPHTWLSVENAMTEAETIKDALVKADAAHADYYEANYQEYRLQLEKLDEVYRSELTDLNTNVIVVVHEAFGYLCEAYGLQQEAVEGLNADSEPDSARMKEIIDFCKENKVKVIFFEELVSPKVAQTIADEVGARTAVLNPVEGLTAEQETRNLDYIGLMEENLSELKKALKEGE